MSAALGLALVTLIAQMESAGRTRVLVLNDCPDGLQGFYAPSRNRIGLCRNNRLFRRSSPRPLLSYASGQCETALGRGKRGG